MGTDAGAGKEAKKRILVVDDHEDNVEVLRARLESRGYDVEGVMGGQEALDAVARRVPDMILLDAMMPRMSGLDVLRTLRESGSETPILIVSAHREVEAVEQVEGLGANGCVGKPIDFDDLLKRIAALTT